MILNRVSNNMKKMRTPKKNGWLDKKLHFGQNQTFRLHFFSYSTLTLEISMKNELEDF